MLSLDYELSVPGFKSNEIGYQTLVRTKPAVMQINLTNDGRNSLYKLNVKPVLESYIGQEDPKLFHWSEAQIIDHIEPKTMVALTFRIWPHFPGLVAVAIHVTDDSNNAVMAKRQTETAYKQLPVRWWFHVVDNISVEILRTLKALVAQTQKDTEKPKTKKPKEAKK